MHRASSGGAGVGMSHGASSQPCCQKTWHSGEMCNRKVARDVSGVFCGIVRIQLVVVEELVSLLHLAT